LSYAATNLHRVNSDTDSYSDHIGTCFW